MAPDQRPPFPIYLLPSLPFPFRRRKSSTTSTVSSPSELVPPLSWSPTSSPSASPVSSPSSYYIQQTGRTVTSNEPAAGPKLRRTDPNTLKCITCSTDIAFASQIVSKGFTGRQGRAYLVSPPPASFSPPSASGKQEKQYTDLINIKIGRAVNRDLLTGAHVVADVSCSTCGTILGWKYVDAKEAAQMYKIGKFILEMKRVVLNVRWEDEGTEDHTGEMLQMEQGAEDTENNVVVFDSDDEDDCEDLFSGIWDAAVVAKRRSRRVAARRKAGGA